MGEVCVWTAWQWMPRLSEEKCMGRAVEVPEGLGVGGQTTWIAIYMLQC